MTEKDYNPERRNKKVITGVQKSEIKNIPKDKLKSEKKEKVEDKTEMPVEENKSEKGEEKKTEAKPEKKKPVQTKPKEKKFDAVVNALGVRVSTKKSIDVCNAIRGKKISDAIAYLETIASGKKALPMKGEYPHQKGIMSGRFPKKTAEAFIVLLKSLQANANVNEIEEPIVAEAIANIAPRPYAKFGRWRKKRTHIKLVARSRIKTATEGK